MNKNYIIIGTGVILVAIFAAVTFMYKDNQTQQLTKQATQNQEALERAYSPTKGSSKANVTIVEFFDPACETCRAFHPLVKQLMDKHPRKVRLVMRYSPFHKGSDYAVRILQAAHKQRLFWQTLEAIYAAQPAWASHHNPQPERIWEYLNDVGLNIEKLKVDMNGQLIIDQMTQDIFDARQLQVTKTPGFFVNGKPLVQFGYQQLVTLVEEELKKTK